MRSFSQGGPGRFPPGSFGEDYPLSAVDEFTCRVEVTGVACRFSDHMQQDLAQVVEPPAAKQASGHHAGALSREVAAMMASASSISRR